MSFCRVGDHPKGGGNNLKIGIVDIIIEDLSDIITFYLNGEIITEGSIDDNRFQISSEYMNKINSCDFILGNYTFNNGMKAQLYWCEKDKNHISFSFINPIFTNTKFDLYV